MIINGWSYYLFKTFQARAEEFKQQFSFRFVATIMIKSKRKGNNIATEMQKQWSEEFVNRFEKRSVDWCWFRILFTFANKFFFIFEA